MKKLLFTLGVLMVFIMEIQAVDFYTNVTNFWYQGQKTKVLALGEQRLNINSNDMPGLIIKLAYADEFSQLGVLSNLYHRVLSLGETITNENFTMQYPLLKYDTEGCLEFLTTYHPSPAELLQEQAKGLLTEKPFPYDFILEALQKDGLCKPLEP